MQDGRTGATLGWQGLLDELAAADVVFLGESHTDETTHRVELAVYEGLLARREQQVVLALEMFERDVQPVLDDYLAGRIDEPAFLERARPWSNYHTAYRPMIEHARAGGLPVVASNFPGPLRRAAASAIDAGAGDLSGLPEAAAGQVPATLLPNTPAYWRRVDNAIRGHLAMMRQRSDDDQRLGSTQTLWDNSMGESCARALGAHPGWMVLHVNGGFHSAYWDGSVRQLMLRKPEAKVLTVAIDPIGNPSVADTGGLPEADYVVFVEQRASDLNEGSYTVSVPRELEYSLALPEGASDEHPVPLLIWLGDDGLTSRDGLALLQQRFGDECALAVVQAPYLETGPDLSPGGRWFWADHFPEDIGFLSEGLERIWGYLLRHEPIDPGAVCLAGEGTGASVVCAVTLLSDRLELNAIALRPRRYEKIRDFPLPLPELRGDDPPPHKTLAVLVGPEARPWWDTELDEYTKIGFDARAEPLDPDPWQTAFQDDELLRPALGLEKHPSHEVTSHEYVLRPGDTPRARLWSRLLAQQRQAGKPGLRVAVLSRAPDAGDATAVPLVLSPEALAEPSVLPACPGPFGGTTVLVLGEDLGPERRAAYEQLQQQDPLTARSRFLRLRVAGSEPGHTLPEVLATLRSEGRRNVLVVPAAFCASPATMRALRQSVAEVEQGMTLHWLPGLGGSLTATAD